MARILRGEIWWADLDPVQGSEQGGRRPVLVLSHEMFNRKSSTAIVLAITSKPQRAGFPLTLELNEELGKPSWVKISQIRLVSTERLSGLAGHVEDETLDETIEGLLELIS